MSEEFKVEIVNPEKSFLSKEDSSYISWICEIPKIPMFAKKTCTREI